MQVARMLAWRTAAVAVAALLLAGAAQARTKEVVLHAFTGGRDGGGPNGLIADNQGKLYGTARFGGRSYHACHHGCGLVYKISRDGTQTVLHQFHGDDGYSPAAPLLADGNGNLFGTTSRGGSMSGGVVFKLAPDGTYTVLHNFCILSPCTDGNSPIGALVKDASGNLYGATYAGGPDRLDGTIFKIAPDGTETTLYAFCQQKNCVDGSHPWGVVADGAGNLYGATFAGGSDGFGAVFKLATDGTETVLHSFCQPNSCGDGSSPSVQPIMDSDGNLYGSTLGGGTGSPDCGIVYKLSPDGAETILHDFSQSDGCQPGGLAFDTKGNILGVTYLGGAKCLPYGCGTVFQIQRGGNEFALLNFGRPHDGRLPSDALVADAFGNWYGTTNAGGNIKACEEHDGKETNGCGVVFELRTGGAP